jgi:hypothetical protein
MFAIRELREKNGQAAISPHSHQERTHLPMVYILQGEQLDIILHQTFSTSGRHKKVSYFHVRIALE